MKTIKVSILTGLEWVIEDERARAVTTQVRLAELESSLDHLPPHLIDRLEAAAASSRDARRAIEFTLYDIIHALHRTDAVADAATIVTDVLEGLGFTGGLRSDDDECRLRALVWYREHVYLATVLRNKAPSLRDGRAYSVNGRNYVSVASRDEALAVFRVRPNGRLRPLRDVQQSYDWKPPAATNTAAVAA